MPASKIEPDGGPFLFCVLDTIPKRQNCGQIHQVRWDEKTLPEVGIYAIILVTLTAA